MIMLGEEIRERIAAIDAAKHSLPASTGATTSILK
jgi:hypothetical protein